MIVIPIALDAHYQQATTTICVCMKIARRDGVVYGLTSIDRPVPFDGITYYPGFDPGNIEGTAGLAVSNANLRILKPGNLFPDIDLIAGLWNYAQVEVFECNYERPQDGRKLIKRGSTGEATIELGVWTIELRGLNQALQQAIGPVTSKTCRARLGDDACTVDLAPYTFNFTVTSVASNQVFTASAAVQADEYFVEGSVEFTSGENGPGRYSQKVKVFDSGVFTTAIPMPFPVAIGDTFIAIAGCQKRHERTSDNPGGISDCVDKFDNILNFQGEPHLAGVDGLTALPTP